MIEETFFQIPKVLLFSDKYKSMKDGTKVLYGFLYETLSNTAIVQNNRLFVLMTLSDIAKRLGCCVRSVCVWLSELEQYNLITKGEKIGKTPKIYLNDAETGKEITPEYYNRKT